MVLQLTSIILICLSQRMAMQNKLQQMAAKILYMRLLFTVMNLVSIKELFGVPVENNWLFTEWIKVW